MINILVVEDDPKLNSVLCSFLAKNGYNAIGCSCPAEAYNASNGTIYDLIISDIMMPGTDGFEFADNIRKTNSNIPIMFVTARDDFSAKEKGFRMGIDDYMVKPFDFEELLLRVKALLRRSNISSSRKITLKTLTLDADELSVTLNGENIPITVREFNILFKLLSYPKITFSRAKLLDEFWGVDNSTTLRSVDVYITKLRSKFAACEDFEIVTVHGLGYKAVLK